MTVFKKLLDKIERKKKKVFIYTSIAIPNQNYSKPEAAANQATTL